MAVHYSQKRDKWSHYIYPSVTYLESEFKFALKFITFTTKYDQFKLCLKYQIIPNIPCKELGFLRNIALILHKYLDIQMSKSSFFIKWKLENFFLGERTIADLHKLIAS